MPKSNKYVPKRLNSKSNKVTPLKPQDAPRTIGVNSFGAGGTNAHVVWKEWKDPSTLSEPMAEDNIDHAILYLLSANHKDALKSLALKHSNFLNETKARLSDIAFSAFKHRGRYPHVVAIVAQSKKGIALKLQKFAEGEVIPFTLVTNIKREKKPKLGFIYSGQGGQWIQMASQLRLEPIFRDTFNEIDRLFQKLSGWSLRLEMEKAEKDSKIDETTIVQPAVMAIQIALTKLYAHYGIIPQGVLGHSIGEVAASYASGALSLEEAVQVIYYRSQAQDKASGKGGMLAVGVSLVEAQKLIKSYAGKISIGAVNGPEMLTLSGDFEPLEQIAKLLEAKWIFNRNEHVKVPLITAIIFNP